MTVMNQKGFTLLESLTVLMIGSIMLSLLFAALPPVYEKELFSTLSHSLKRICFTHSRQLSSAMRRLRCSLTLPAAAILLSTRTKAHRLSWSGHTVAILRSKKRRSSELLLLTQAEFRIKGENRDRYTARLFCTDDLFRKRKD